MDVVEHDAAVVHRLELPADRLESGACPLLIGGGRLLAQASVAFTHQRDAVDHLANEIGVAGAVDLLEERGDGCASLQPAQDLGLVPDPPHGIMVEPVDPGVGTSLLDQDGGTRGMHLSGIDSSARVMGEGVRQRAGQV